MYEPRPSSSDRSSTCSCLVKTIIVVSGLVLASFTIFKLTTTKKPVFYLTDLQSSSNSSSISYDLDIKNRNILAGVYYDDLRLSFGNVSSVVIKGFYQGHHKETSRKGDAEWDGSAIGTEGVRVGLDGRYKYKGLLWWRSGKHEAKVIADGVKIGGDGKFVSDGRIPLVASSAVRATGTGRVKIGIILTALGFFLLL